MKYIWKRATQMVASLTLASGGLAGCGGDSPGTTGPAPTVSSVTVSPTDVSLKVGEQRQLVAEVAVTNGASQAVTWNSTDVSAVTVNATGQVTAIHAGNASVCAKSTADATKSACAAVVVSVPVATVTVTPPTATLNVAATQQLTVTTRDENGAVLTGRAVTWASSDVSRATVSNTGLVTGVASGAVLITASSEGKIGASAFTVTTNGCALLRPIAVGATTTGVLAPTDCLLSNGSYAQKYELNLAAATAVQVEMNSTIVDSYLYVFNATNGAIAAQDDDAAGGKNARVETVLPAGRYLIYANTFNADEFGAYQLTVRAAPAGCLTTRTINLPQVVAGTLSTTGSCRLQDGSLADRYQVTLTQKVTLQIDMTSAAFDAYVFVQNSTGAVIGLDDDGLGGTNASLQISLDPGTYIINANSFDANQIGNYTLTVKPFVDPCALDVGLTFGNTIFGALSTNSCQTNDGSYVRRYTLTLATATNVRIDMINSGGLDPYLVVQRASDNAVLAEDDDSGGGLNARLQGILPPGTYIVNATTYDPGEVGTFQLTVTSSEIATPVAITVNPTVATVALGQTQQISATVTGTNIVTTTWTSSAPGVASVSNTGLVRAISSGTATITATSTIDPSKSAAATITVPASGGAVNLDIASAYIVQAVQTQQQIVPLVPDRAAMVRVFVRGSQAGLATAKVRLKVFDAGVLKSTLTANATPQTTVNEACCSAAEFTLPAALVHQGMAVLADVDPDNTVAEASEGDNVFPTTGLAMNPTFVRSPDFNIRLIPVRQSKNNRTGNAATSLLNHVQSLWPISKMNATSHAVYTTDLPPLDANDANGSWTNLLKEIDALRRLENSVAYYYGVVNPSYNAGIVGLGYISGKSAIGVDWGSNFGSTTLAHELGHNFSRHHAPCAGAFAPANVDQSYPFANGTTGIFGIDLFNNNTRYAPTATDIMSYCDNQWVSSYNYLAVANYRNATPNSIMASVANTSVLIISGNVTRNGVKVDPVFSNASRPDVSDNNGSLEAVGRTSDGRVLFQHRFRPLPVEDGDTTQLAYVVSVPVNDKWRDQVTEIEVREVAQARRTGTRSKQKESVAQTFGLVGLQAATIGGSVQFKWDAASYPTIIVRNKRTGEVIERNSSGTSSLASNSSDDLEILMSNGIGSVTRTFVRSSGLVRP